MAEAASKTADDFAPPGQLFIECAKDGRVLWMNEKARQRLGAISSLRESFAPEQAAELQRFLSDSEADIISGLFRRADGSSVPVSLSCFTRMVKSVILSAEVRERVSDRLGVVSDELLSMHGVVLSAYFRLLRAQQLLDSRLMPARRNPGLILIEQMERERARLARELHSGPGQWLSAITVHVELIGKLIDQEHLELPAKFQEYMTRIANAAVEAGAEVRAVSHRLHMDWQSLSLQDALRNLWNNSGIAEKFEASLTVEAIPGGLPIAVRAAIYRAAQEGLSNAVRHSGATVMKMSVEQSLDNLRLSIEDNGTGFDPNVRPSSGGIGLRSIREQVEILGGAVHIASGPEGTKLEVLVPIDPLDQ